MPPRWHGDFMSIACRCPVFEHGPGPLFNQTPRGTAESTAIIDIRAGYHFKVVCRLPTEDDVPRLMSFMPSLEHDPRLYDGMQQILSTYLDRDRSCGQASFCRVIEVEGVTGFISANLIHTGVAEIMESRADSRFIINPETVSPLSDEELREANQSRGACLVLNPTGRSTPDLEISPDFGRARFDHLTRWFEGNRINSVVFTFRDKYKDHFAGLLNSMKDEMYSVTDLKDGRILVRAVAPWRPRTLNTPWIGHLLRQFECPRQKLPDDLKQTGRLFHEFEFKIAEVIPSCFPNWPQDISYIKHGERPRGADAYCSKVSKALNLNPDKSSRTVMREVEALFASNPRILTLY